MNTVVLSATDRCDRCGAKAYVLVSLFVAGKGNHELLFCAHDYRRHELQLQSSGARVLLDQRRELSRQASLASPHLTSPAWPSTNLAPTSCGSTSKSGRQIRACSNPPTTGTIR